MVRPTSLKGACCATGVPAVSVDASHKPAIKVLMDASLLRRHSLAGDRCGRYQLAGMRESLPERESGPPAPSASRAARASGTARYGRPAHLESLTVRGSHPLWRAA